MEEDIQITLRQHIEEAYQNAFDEDPQKGRGWQRKCDKFSDVDFMELSLNWRHDVLLHLPGNVLWQHRLQQSLLKRKNP